MENEYTEMKIWKSPTNYFTYTVVRVVVIPTWRTLLSDIQTEILSTVLVDYTGRWSSSSFLLLFFYVFVLRHVTLSLSLSLCLSFSLRVRITILYRRGARNIKPDKENALIFHPKVVFRGAHIYICMYVRVNTMNKTTARDVNKYVYIVNKRSRTFIVRRVVSPKNVSEP